MLLRSEYVSTGQSWHAPYGPYVPDTQIKRQSALVVLLGIEFVPGLQGSHTDSCVPPSILEYVFAGHDRHSSCDWVPFLSL